MQFGHGNKTPFITFEGGEGSGKSTQIKLLVSYLREHGLTVEQLREPGGTDGAEAIRSMILTGDTKSWDPVSEALLMSAARRDLVTKKIEPLLDEGTWIVCDRFFDSTTAYQGFGHGIGYDKIQSLNKFVVGDVVPSLTFIIDMPPEEGIERTVGRNHDEDRFERMGLEFHQRVREGFLQIFRDNADRCVLLNGRDSVEDIATSIRSVIDERFSRLMPERTGQCNHS